MASFCVKCGAPLSGGPFCVKCGADTRSTALEPQAKPVASFAPTPRGPATPAPSPLAAGSASKKMSPLAKLAIVAVAIIFVGGVAGAVGVYYVAHRVSQKMHQLSDGILESNSSTSNSRDVPAGVSSSQNGSIGNVCRFLSKEDVGKAIGIEITHTQPEDNGCSYLAKGTAAEMASRHATAMAGDLGADQKTQQMVQTFAGGLGKMLESEKPASEQSNPSGEVPVFSFSVDQNGAEEQFRLNAGGLSIIGPKQDLPGLGDQAFASSDGMIFMRKGKNLFRILYISCPCGTKEVVPLAKKLADSL